MIDKLTTCYEAKCRRIRNEQKNITQIGNMVPGPKCDDMNQRAYQILR